MWETKDIELNVRLPRNFYEKAIEVHADDPQFLSRVVLYGLTRKLINNISIERHGGSYSSSKRSLPFSFDTDFEFTVSLPTDIAEQAQEVQKEDPEFLSYVVVYGLSAGGIYRQLHDRSQIGRQRLIDFGMDPNNPG